MRIRSKRSSHFKYRPDINLNSFLDLILNVLLFFVFATELAAFQSLEVTVPSSKSATSESRDQNQILVIIAKDNQINVDGNEVNQSKLATWLTTHKKEDSVIVIRGDLESNLQAMVDVLSACRQAHIDKVKVETKSPASD